MTDAAPAYRLREELRGTLADHPDFDPEVTGAEHADTPIFQGASITGVEGKTWHIEDLIAEREDGIIVTADQDLINALEHCPAVERCEAPESPDYNKLKVAELLQLPQAAHLPDAGQGLKKPQLVAGLYAVDEGKTGDELAAAIANAAQEA